MRNIVTIHQPNYLPWIGFFSKVSKSDCFVIADTFAYTKNSVVNRNKIRTGKGWSYLTIPLNREFYQSRICDVTLPLKKTWRENHWKSIYTNYKKAKFFDLNADFFEELYLKDYKYLWEINIEIIIYLLKCFQIEVEIIKSSGLDVDNDLRQTDALVAILKAVGARTYLSGPSGRSYLDYEKFPKNNLNLIFFYFQHPVYPQRYLGFEPNMSAIDLLFNMGPDASRIIASSGTIEDK
jgi:hypothetical protein